MNTLIVLFHSGAEADTQPLVSCQHYQRIRRSNYRKMRDTEVTPMDRQDTYSNTQGQQSDCQKISDTDMQKPQRANQRGSRVRGCDQGTVVDDSNGGIPYFAIVKIIKG